MGLSSAAETVWVRESWSRVFVPKCKVCDAVGTIIHSTMYKEGRFNLSETEHFCDGCSPVCLIETKDTVPWESR